MIGFDFCESNIHEYLQVPLSLLQQEFGKKFGETLHQLAAGRDDKPLNFGQVRKSVSAEVNYGIRFKAVAELETFLKQLCEEVQRRLVDARRMGKCITLKYMVRAADAPVETAKFMGHGICDVVNKSHTLIDFTADVEVITKAVLQLNGELNVPPEELRGIGVQVTKLDGATTAAGEEHVKDSRLKEMFNKVQQKNQLANNITTSENKKPPIPPQTTTSITSPSKDKKKSPAKRGRPKKGAKAVKTKAITELMRPVEDDLNQDVLNELPEEFRAEAIRNHRLLKQFQGDQKKQETTKKKETKKKKKTDRPAVDEEFLAALPPDIRREVEQEMGINTGKEREEEEKEEEKKRPPPNVVSPDNVFLQSNWKDLLSAWIATSEEPEAFDVSVVVAHWRELIANRQMIDVYAQLRFFYRVSNASTKCGWHRGYAKIAKEIQETMRSVLMGRNMAIPDEITCNKCHEGDKDK